MERFFSCVLAGALIVLNAGAALGADGRQIDVEQSKLTVFVYKSGLFSAFADNHIVDAPLASGSISEEPPLSVSIEVRAADLRVRDPNLSPDKRAEVQQRMAGPEVLDVARYASIAFESTGVDPDGPERWKVTGRLTIHGQTRMVAFSVARMNGRYRGTVPIKQRDFGIAPISIAGGTVKVKDELKIDFDIAVR